MQDQKQTPFVRKMIVEAVNSIGGQTSYKEIINWINEKYTDVNERTIRAQIIVLTVNHESRIHYPEVSKPRLTSPDNIYDFLYRLRKGEGVVEKYDVKKHGIWEVYLSTKANLAVRRYNNALEERIFTPSDIIWFKNVSNHLPQGAYFDISTDDFIMHFPNRHVGNAKKPKPGEIILLYQSVNRIGVFSHLVTPVDNMLLENLKNGDHSIGRRVKSIAMTDIDSSILVKNTIWRKVRLSGVTQGNACKIDNISGVKNPDLYRLEMWNKFKRFFINGDKYNFYTSILDEEIELSNGSVTVEEGKLKLISHMARERNRRIVNLKKEIALQKGNLCCEVCNFSFRNRYGKDFIECHHLNPIGENNGQETTLDDLALVCANCHRMLHTKFGSKFLSIKELKEVLKSGS